ncbi:MAG: hypothetical protein ABI885_22195, partial [Gammaproteobacteria bacterium]
MTAAVLRIALDMPMRRLFDYLPAEGVNPAAVEIGQRVRVPFGRQQLIGLVMEHAASSELPAARLKSVLDVLDVVPLLDRPALELLRWAADYYHHPIGEVIATAIPKALRAGASTVAIEQVWSPTAEGAEAFAGGEPRRAPKQKQLLAHLVEQKRVSASHLASFMEDWHSAARALARRGWAASAEQAIERVSPAADLPNAHDRESNRSGPLELAPEQHEAVEKISESIGRFGAFVLHG